MKIVVVGNGMVSFKFCERLRKIADSNTVQLVVFGEESYPAYDRVHLSKYFENQQVEELLLAPKEWYSDNDIDLRTGELVTAMGKYREL